MPPPQAILCHLCNGKFFKRSYPIHLKQCEKKWKLTHSRCEKCGSVIANSDWSDHLQICKKIRGKRLGSKTDPVEPPKSHSELVPSAIGGKKVSECEECEAENAVWHCRQCEQMLCVSCESELHRKGARARHERIPVDVSAFSAENMKKGGIPGSVGLSVPEPTEDPRHPCEICGRKFNPDRVQRHMRICASNQRRNRKRKTWDGSAKRVIGTDFEEFMYRRAPTPPEVHEWRKNGRRWRKERDQFRELMGLPETDDEKELEEPVKSKKHHPVSARSAKSSQSVKSTKSTGSTSGKKSTMRQAGQTATTANVSKPEAPSRQTSASFSTRFTPKRATPKKVTAKRATRTTASGVSGQSMRFSNREASSSTTQQWNRKIPRSTKPKKRLPPWGSSKSHPSRKPRDIVKKVQRNPPRRSRSDAQQDKPSKKPAVPRQEKSERNAVERSSAPPKPQRRGNLRRLKSLLPRGHELGSEGNETMFVNKPSGMDDYRRREQIRAQKMLDAHSSLLKENITPAPTAKKAITRKVKDMTRVEKRRVIQSEGQVGGSRAGKPRSRQDLAAKRASYFESVLQS